ncbi:MAG: hypothetical protein WC515_08040 [Candidatus Omnitrophota bacterium]
MGWKERVRKDLYWLGGITLAAIWYIFAEGWLILMVRIFGFSLSTVIVTLILIILSWFVIYVASGAGNIGRFREWLKEKEDSISPGAKTAVGGGKVLAVLNTAVFLGPMVSAVLMLMLGTGRNKAYLYSVFCAFLCAVVWCGFYSGIFWEIQRIFAGS